MRPMWDEIFYYTFSSKNTTTQSISVIFLRSATRQMRNPQASSFEQGEASMMTLGMGCRQQTKNMSQFDRLACFQKHTLSARMARVLLGSGSGPAGPQCTRHIRRRRRERIRKPRNETNTVRTVSNTLLHHCTKHFLYEFHLAELQTQENPVVAPSSPRSYPCHRTLPNPRVVGPGRGCSAPGARFLDAAAESAIFFTPARTRRLRKTGLT